MLTKKTRRAETDIYRLVETSPLVKKWDAADQTMFGAVYWKPGNYTREELVHEFTCMKETGFNLVRFHTAFPEEIGPGEYNFSRTNDWFSAAKEVGIQVFFCLRDKDHNIGPLTLAKHGLDAESFENLYADDPRYAGILHDYYEALVHHVKQYPALLAYGGFGEPGPGQDKLENKEDETRFVQWLEKRYETLEALDRAWNIYPEKGKTIRSSFEEAPRIFDGIRVDQGYVNGVFRSKINYGAWRDLAEFLTQKNIDKTARAIEVIKTMDPDHPLIVGSHAFLVNPVISRWNQPLYARLGDGHFSSIHLPWNKDLVNGEIDVPVYLQARYTRDLRKGGITAAFETTGGPVQYSGGFGNAMTPGLMRRLCLSYLASGHTNIAFWTWNPRPGGWEAGEYGLTTLSGKVSSWAREAGQIGKALQQYAHELRFGDQQPQVGVVESWDTDAILQLEPNRKELMTDVASPVASGTAHQRIRARVGIVRALTNAHIPFEFVTEPEVLENEELLQRYPVLYVPHARALSDETIASLTRYAEQGGTLIADVQFGFLDPYGKLRRTGDGSMQEKLFGAYVEAIHDTRTNALSVKDVPVEGFYAELSVTDAKVIQTFSDGTPAVTEKVMGRGKAVFVGFDAARMCQKPGSPMEAVVAELCGGDKGWQCSAPLAFRIRCEKADHYFMINEGDAMRVELEASDADYTSVLSVLEQKSLGTASSVSFEMEQESALWIRCEPKEKDT